MTSPLRIRWYFWYAVIVLGLNMVLAGWALFKGPALGRGEADPTVLPDVVDYGKMVLELLFPAAMFGLAARFVHKPVSVRRYFAAATLVGFTAVYGGHAWLELTLRNCADQCLAGVPSAATLAWVAVAAAVPGVLAPLLFTVLPWRKHEPLRIVM